MGPADKSWPTSCLVPLVSLPAPTEKALALVSRTSTATTLPNPTPPLCPRRACAGSAVRRRTSMAEGPPPRSWRIEPVGENFKVVFTHSDQTYELGLFSTKEEGTRVADVLTSERRPARPTAPAAQPTLLPAQLPCCRHQPPRQPASPLRMFCSQGGGGCREGPQHAAPGVPAGQVGWAGVGWWRGGGGWGRAGGPVLGWESCCRRRGAFDQV